MALFRDGRVRRASFRGARFFITSTSGGNAPKGQAIEFANTSKRKVNFVGKRKKIMDIECFTDDNISFRNRDKLLKALRKDDEGTLYHSTQGKIYGFVEDFKDSESDTKMGITNFSIRFVEVDKTSLIEKLSPALPAFLKKLKEDIYDKYGEKFQEAWKKIENVKEGFESMNETLNDVSAGIRSITSKVQGFSDLAADFTTSLNSITNDTKSLIKSPFDLINNFKTCFTNLVNAFENAGDVFSVLKDMKGFNERDRVYSGNSTLDQQINNNQDLMNNSVQIFAFAGMLEVSASIDYKNIEQLNQVIKDIDDFYNSLPEIDREIRLLIDNMRIQANSVFSQLLISLPRIIEIEVNNPRALASLVYAYYGNLSNYDIIANLNNIKDRNSVSGKIKIISV